MLGCLFSLKQHTIEKIILRTKLAMPWFNKGLEKFFGRRNKESQPPQKIETPPRVLSNQYRRETGAMLEPIADAAHLRRTPVQEVANLSREALIQAQKDSNSAKVILDQLGVVKPGQGESDMEHIDLPLEGRSISSEVPNGMTAEKPELVRRFEIFSQLCQQVGREAVSREVQQTSPEIMRAIYAAASDLVHLKRYAGSEKMAIISSLQHLIETGRLTQVVEIYQRNQEI